MAGQLGIAMLAPGGPLLREAVVWSKPRLNYREIRIQAGAGDIGNRGSGSGRPRLWTWLLGFWAATRPLRRWCQRLRAPSTRKATPTLQPRDVVKGQGPTVASQEPVARNPPARRRSYPPLPPAPGKLSPSEKRQWRREQRFQEMKKKRKAGRAEERRKAALRRKAARQELMAKMTEEEKCLGLGLCARLELRVKAFLQVERCLESK